jgi:AsmA protein
VVGEPVVTFESEADGHANWIFERPPHPARQSHDGETFMSQFGSIEFRAGRIRYNNVRTGSTRAVSDVQATVHIDDSSRELHADGTFVLNGRRVAFKGNAATQPTTAHVVKANLIFSSDLLFAKFGGVLNQNGSIGGDIALQAPIAREAGTWLGARMPNIKGLGALSLESRIEADEQSVRLRRLKASLDGISVDGDLFIDIRRHVPLVEGDLHVDHLNLNPYIEHPGNIKPHNSHHPDDEWSEKPIALDALRAVDARLSVSAGDISVRKLKLGRTDIHLDLANSDLQASLGPMTLYGGKGMAQVHVKANLAAPVFHNTLEVSNIALEPFLSDTIGVKHIEGTGAIRLDLVSQGNNANTIMHGIAGNGTILFRNGRLRGVDLGAVARTIQTLLGNAVTGNAITAYSLMGGTFTASDGVLTSEDFRVSGPLLDAKGAGRVDVGNRAIDFRIVPQASAVLMKHKLTVGVPFHIEGPWKHLRYKANLNGIVKGVIENLEFGQAPFKGLFGPSKPKDPTAPKKKHKSTEDALKNMLGIH